MPNRLLDCIRRAALLRDGGGLSDVELLARFVQHRDADAFTALLNRHGPMVMGVCRRVLQNAHDAEDAFQATFLIFARKAGSVTAQDSIAGWLYRVAYRAALEARARIERRRAKVMKSGTVYFWFIADLPSIPCSSDKGYLNYEGRAATAEEAMTAAENAMPDEEEYRAMQAEAESLWGK